MKEINQFKKPSLVKQIIISSGSKLDNEIGHFFYQRELTSFYKLEGGEISGIQYSFPSDELDNVLQSISHYKITVINHPVLLNSDLNRLSALMNRNKIVTPILYTINFTQMKDYQLVSSLSKSFEPRINIYTDLNINDDKVKDIALVGHYNIEDEYILTRIKNEVKFL